MPSALCPICHQFDPLKKSVAAGPPVRKRVFYIFIDVPLPPSIMLAITHIYPSPPRGICSKLNNRKSMNIEYPPAMQRAL